MALQSQQFSAPDEFERLYVRPKAGRTLIVGSYITKGKPDRRARHADAVGIDMRDGPGVDRVIDAHDPAVFAHDPAITAGIGQLDSQDGHLFATLAVSRRTGGFAQTGQRIGRGERHVAVQDQRGHGFVKPRGGLHDRVTGAQLRHLARPGDVVGSQLLRHLLAAVAIDHDQALRR